MSKVACEIASFECPSAPFKIIVRFPIFEMPNHVSDRSLTAAKRDAVSNVKIRRCNEPQALFSDLKPFRAEFNICPSVSTSDYSNHTLMQVQKSRDAARRSKPRIGFIRPEEDCRFFFNSEHEAEAD
ncbi:hypothetical protein [Rhizobium sp. NPDC090279]|uniref:hypothetical protein n=1 Tax=Rhizobium sp. NPDC090279 TaxID=3364499 RepID=UPI00383A620B